MKLVSMLAFILCGFLNFSHLSFPPKLKQLVDANNALEARLYAYKNNNFSFPIYGVKMTTTYNGRTVSDRPQDMTCYFLGDKDYVAMIIGENFTGVFVKTKKVIQGYDVYELYPYCEGENVLYIGKGNSQDKIILKTEGVAASGSTKTIRAEWTTNKSASKTSQSVRSSGNPYYMPSTPNQSRSSSTTSTRRTCPACHGTGKGTDRIVYQPDYTGKQANVYCSKCGKYGSPHTHNEPMCRTCYGRGYIE